MATSRPHIRENRQPNASPSFKSPKVTHSPRAVHSPKLGESPSKKPPLSSNDVEGSDYDEFIDFDQPDRSTSNCSPLLNADLRRMVPPESVLPPMLNPRTAPPCSFLEDSSSPLKTNCKNSPEWEVHQRRRKVKASLTPDRSSQPSKKMLHQSNDRGLVCSIIWCLLVALAIAILVYICIYSYYHMSAHGGRNKNLTEIFDEMKLELRAIRSSMEQTKHLWTQILSQLTSLVEETIQQPSVIMVVVPKNSQKTAFCLISSLSKMITNAFDDSGFVMFDVASHLNDPTYLKGELDENLSGLSDAHAAVVYNIEKLPGDAAMMFHAYCDNENAPFKRALMFLTLEVESKFDEIDARKLDLFVSQLLMDSWMTKIREEDVGALIARVANAPVLVKPEPNEVLNSVCDF